MLRCISKRQRNTGLVLLAINEEFVSIQGEGEFTGKIMYFVRVQGCTVGCHFCDTKHSWRPQDATTSEEDIIQRVKESGVDVVCITGGEPAEHDLLPLIKLCHKEGLLVHIESSGIGNVDQFETADWVTISPKDRFSDGVSCIKVMDELKCVVTCLEDARYYNDRYGHLPPEYSKVLQPVSNNRSMAIELTRLNLKGWLIKGQQQVLFDVR